MRAPILDMLPDTTDDTRDTTREGGAQSPELFNGFLVLGATRAPILDMLPDTTDDARDTAREGGVQSPELFNMYRDCALYNARRQSTRT